MKQDDCSNFDKGARELVGKTTLQDLEEKMKALTPSQRKVADHILKYPMEAAFLTIEQMARQTSVSVATIIRLAYSLGYDGYTQFQKALQALLRDQISPPNRLEANLKKIGKNKLLIDCAELQIKNIRKTVEFLSEENIDQAFSLIFASRKIYVIGIRSSLAVANYLNEGLNRLGIDCEMVVPDTGRIQGRYGSVDAGGFADCHQPAPLCETDDRSREHRQAEAGENPGDHGWIFFAHCLGGGRFSGLRF